jgi:DNA-binding transcriptional regulator YiaG
MSASTRPTFQPGSRHTAKGDLTTYYPLRILLAVQGEELRKIRKQMGLTQAEFGDLVGVHWNSIARQERNEIGIREPLARLIRLLAEQHRQTEKERKRGS